MKNLLTTLFIGIIVIGSISSCNKKEKNEELDRNAEKLVYQKTPSETKPNSKTTIDLQNKITKTVQINYENDGLVPLRTDKKWENLLRKNGVVLDKGNIKKTSIERTKIQLVTIPFKSDQEQGFFNVYLLNGQCFWTKVLTKNLPNGAKTYTISADNGENLMKLDLDQKFVVSNFSAPKNNKVLAQKPEFSTELLRLAVAEEAEKECYKVKGATFWDCLTCVLIKHCGNDLACVIACTVAPEICLGVSILACLPLSKIDE